MEIQNFSSSVEIYFTSERRKRVKYFSTREEKFLISKRPCNVLFIIKTPNDEIPDELSYAAKGASYCVTIDGNGDLFTCEDNMLFSHVKISCFRAKAHLVFHWCLYNKVFLAIIF